LESRLFRRKRFRGLAFIEHDGRKRIDVSRIVLPGFGGEPGLQAEFLKVGFPVPALFGWHLRKKDSLAAALHQQQAVPADAYVLEVENVVERREHRDFVFQLREFPGAHRGKTRITQRCVCGGIPYSEIQRLLRRSQTNAPAQLSLIRECHERAAFLLECGEIGGRRLVQFLFAYSLLDGLLRQLDEGVFLF